MQKNLEEIVIKLEKQLSEQAFELQKKERELEIETALEKVRVRATAMRKSDELAETSSVLFLQLKELNIHALRTGVGIFDDPNDAMEIWLTAISESNEVIRILDYVNIHVHKVFENILPAREQNKSYALTVLSGEEIRQFYQSVSSYLALPGKQVYNPKEFYYSFFFAEGTINVITDRALTDEECSIMIRVARVFGLIYTRFLDLQKAEAQAKDNLMQASLDRVRGQIASMRTADDLQRITPLVWNELTILGVPFIRCGIFIIDETAQMVQIYLSTPDGQSLAALHMPVQANQLTRNAVDHWRAKTVYKVHWTKEDFIAWTKSLLEQRQIEDETTYQGAANPPDTLKLHFIPFKQGMLYVGSIHLLDEEEIELVHSLAETFSIAYSRYEDFVELEKAKQSIESALTELQVTQSQLIQAEKMASLGELTAGIAHEIQNPLNFVNNFSEVNRELISEMKEEIEKGNYDEAMKIAADIGDNEEKIVHHGKRADAIVKGMLQHSRSSSGQKEPTDINALCDEYLRLAYHGLRAKDKSFNASMKTDFDNSVGNINIVPQDIGRVILNLITNAFYAVEKKKKDQSNGFEPTVTVGTKKENNQVNISVKDNGTGIPEKNIEKIFQPFFTTKPTGQGTGLGLSLSYDIVKAHGGELKVETKEGEGSTFIIQLPIV